MLKELFVENFAYFKESQALNFEKGQYLLIGENDSGRSILFEIIRGCMSASKSISLLKPHNSANPSIAVCRFDCTREGGLKVVVSALIRPQYQTDEETYYKLIYELSMEDDKLLKLEIQFTNSKGSDGGYIWTPIERLYIEQISRLIQSDKQAWHKKPKTISYSIAQCIKAFSEKNTGKTQSNMCEILLKQYVDESTVVTFPVREISTSQCTKSMPFQQEIKIEGKNVIKWFEDNSSAISDKEKEDQEKYYRLITGKCPPETEKFTEDMHEARKLSVLLAVKRFQTVCLEKPEKSMHPKMMDRIRDLVLPMITDKVVLITSNHPIFLSSLTIPRTFVFQKQIIANDCTTTIVRLLKEKDAEKVVEKQVKIKQTGPKVKAQNEDENEDRTIRLVSNGLLPLLSYASNILLVEGEADFTFTTEMKNFLMTDKSLLQRYIKKSGQFSTDQVKSFLCSLHILPMFGEANKFHYRRFCNRLNKQIYFMMDEDALETNIPGTEGTPIKRFLKLFGIKDISDKQVRGDVSVLEVHDLFIWNGTIETAVISFALRNQKKTFLKRNNIQLDYVRDRRKTESEPVTHAEPVTAKEVDNSGAIKSKEATTHKKRQKKQTMKSSKRKRDFSEKTLNKTQSTDSESDDMKSQEATTSQNRKKKKTSKSKKLFSGKSVTIVNIQNAVKEILNLSVDDKTSDFHRLVMFLIKKSGRQGQYE